LSLTNGLVKLEEKFEKNGMQFCRDKCELPPSTEISNCMSKNACINTILQIRAWGS